MTSCCCVSYVIRRIPRRFILAVTLATFFVSVYVTLRPVLDVERVAKTKKFRLLSDAEVNSHGIGSDVIEESFGECKRPEMDLWHPSMKQHFVIPEPLHCDDAVGNWIYVENATFRISAAAVQQRQKIMCEYRPLVRINDNAEVLGEPVRPFQDGSTILSDFFEARCLSYKGEVYKNLHAAIKPSQSAIKRARAASLPSNALGLNMLMLGFDSVSRLNWIRNLPNSHAYFSDVLGGVTLEGYNIVGDGTPQALLPILTGKTEEELPEARRGFAGARPVDGHPWIWKRYRDAGYVTQWGEDGATVGTFNYRMLGFDREPVDHYLRPYQHLAETEYHKHNYQYCMGSEPRLNVMLSWIRAFFVAYASLPKFSFLFHSEYSHNSFSTLRLADGTLKKFLADMYTSGYLNNTMLVLMADHGARFVNVRQSQQGKYEERLPYFSIRLPEWFAAKYPRAMENLRRNSKRLTTPFDIHETFMDLINYTDSGLASGRPKRAISLFQDIPQNRTCRQAGIAAHWCTCMDWIETSLGDKRVVQAADHVVKVVNQLTTGQRALCAELGLDSIDAAMKLSPNEQMLKFKQSLDDHGRRGDFTDNMTPTVELYQVSITTRPGGAKYEATVTHETFNGSSWSLNEKDISRINRYGSQPHCISEKLPHLRPYCYCNVQLE
ncbi:hypothetical protein LSH36_189g06091 [Paralvinella palmiformis]|uniref:DUF229 domain containing protein n=1 Tax=Paralvinella palmiformis TaxID=53620 RepID=A0AAD9JQH6_9ANNE|nr:hypothetical protein LSH36_189g06091 [Paralvinella palmiformis]